MYFTKAKLLITTWVIYLYQIFAQICGNLNVLGQIIKFLNYFVLLYNKSPFIKGLQVITIIFK